MKNFITLGVVIFFAVFIMTALLCTNDGYNDAEHHYSECSLMPTRAQKVFPFHRLGCWLGDRQ